MTGLMLAVALAGALPAPGSLTPTPNDDEVLVIGEDERLRMTVPVTIDGTPFRFLIDTGAQNTVISDATARRLGLAVTGRANVISVAGSAIVTTTTINGLTLGSRTFDHLTAPILLAGYIGGDGIIGLDTLQRQRITMDFAQRTIAVGDADDAPEDEGYEIVVRARRRSGQLILASAEIDGVGVNVVVDTGSDTTIGNRALQRALAQRRTDDQERSTIISVTGQRLPVDVGIAGHVRLGALDIRNVTIAYADAPPFAHLKLDRKPAILLGMSELRAFRRVAIDFAKRRIAFDLAPPVPAKPRR